MSPHPRLSKGARAASWSFSTISGNWKRGTGVLNNELYIGKLVWNRQRFIKNPETGRRQARPNPPDAWITEEVPDLRIIDDALWQRVKERQGAVRQDNPDRAHRQSARAQVRGWATCALSAVGPLALRLLRIGLHHDQC
ncbi:MAG: recombinase family protein [Tabrizicola sp.]|uniref:recombinase family protein n=1 Tax=Tabrizicola sp. TaxID=2005166 RepID=UPI002ABCE980|nr:recombinase family protein [Tabrizicola sp.]MDZ4085497.1 recombinase family protein [Tabrizicola sp.]